MFNDSADDAYKKARRKAKSRHNTDKSKRINENIPSLDKILNDVNIVAEMPLGIQEIPLERIVGTYYYTRSLTFSSDFLPLADEESEFSYKWGAVYEHHLNDGITDPIKVYEYLNKYYVMEGNKRVSVLKYFDAYSIEGDVTRLIPQRDENNAENVIYYEFLEFSKKTGIGSIWLSHEGNFTELGEYLDAYKPRLTDCQDKYEHFMKHVYLPFRNVFHELGGYKLDMTTGDAFLQYTRIYGISNKFNVEKRKDRVKKLLSELEVLAKENSAEIQTQPFDIQKKNVIASISNLVNLKRKLKVCYVFENTVDAYGWNSSHNDGRIFAEKELKDDIETYYVENVSDGIEGYNTLSKLAEKNYDIIFTTSPNLLNNTLRTALKYDNIKFFNCSPVKAYRNVSTYYGRSHEPRFLLGLIAGSMTKSNIVGYIDVYSKTEKVTGINAFALGVKMVNPYAKVVVSWVENNTDTKSTKNLMLEQYKRGTDIIMQNDLSAIKAGNIDYGLYSIKYDEKINECIADKNYAAVVWNWSKFYEKLLRNISNGNWKGMFSTESKRVSFWWGLDSGLIDIIYSSTKVPTQTQRLVEIMKDQIINKRIHTFTGPIFDQNGICRIEDGDIAKFEQMLYMDWFIDNIEGKIPD